MAAIASWVAEFEDLDDLGRRLEDVGFSYGVVRTLEEVAASDWAKERDVLVEVSDRGDGVFRIPRSPWRFSQSAAGVRGVAAYRGEHNREVFGGLLGLSEDELDALERRGVLSHRPARQG